MLAPLAEKEIVQSANLVSKNNAADRKPDPSIDGRRINSFNKQVSIDAVATMPRLPARCGRACCALPSAFYYC